jgi:hypothetical protein
LDKIVTRKRPEDKIQHEIICMLRNYGWFVKETHGNMYQSGFPDLYASHPTYGSRWIEVKLPGMKGSKFTPAQLRDFPLFCAHGAGVWVLTGATTDEYKKLFTRYNWSMYLL